MLAECSALGVIIRRYAVAPEPRTSVALSDGGATGPGQFDSHRQTSALSAACLRSVLPVWAGSWSPCSGAGSSNDRETAGAMTEFRVAVRRSTAMLVTWRQCSCSPPWPTS